MREQHESSAPGPPEARLRSMRDMEPNTIATIEVFADITCPFTHVGLRRVAAEFGDQVQVRVRAWPLGGRGV